MNCELIEAAARALAKRAGYRDHTPYMDEARAAYAVLAPALLEKGVRLGLEAAEKACTTVPTADDELAVAAAGAGEIYGAMEAIAALNPSEIAKEIKTCPA